MEEKSSTSTKKQTKKYLRTLTKDGGSKLRSTRRVFKYGTISFFRNIWLSIASTLVMVITLLILSATVFSSVLLSETATTIKDKIDITVFLKPGTSEDTLKELENLLSKNENIKQETIVSNTSEKEVELELETQKYAELLEIMNDEDLGLKEETIANMPATIRFKVFDPDDLDSVKQLVEKNELFAENLNEDEDYQPTYDMNQAEIATITSWANIAKNGGFILGAVFLTISVLIIFNTVRMAIFSRREEIYMMKLVGADRSFIRGPFLIEAQLCGFISGLVSATLSYFGFKSITPVLESYEIDLSTFSNVFDTSWLVVFFAAMILLGIIIGSVSARLALKKYLRKL